MIGSEGQRCIGQRAKSIEQRAQSIEIIRWGEGVETRKAESSELKEKS